MLTSEEAAAHLGKRHNPNWLKERIAAAGNLPGASKRLARALLKPKEKGKKPLAEKDDTPDPILLLEELSDSERLRVFEVICPKLAPIVDGAWTRTYGLPFEPEAGRQVFRAPHLPAATRPLRAALLHKSIQAIAGHDADIVWLAESALHLAGRSAADELGLLFAVAIDQGGEEGNKVFDILCRSARGEHTTGVMGRHLVRGLLCCARREGWELLFHLLRKDGGNESTAHVILEAMDFAQPRAFRWMLRQLVDGELVRSPSVIHTLDTWFGYQWDAVSERVVRGVVDRVLRFLEEPKLRHESIANSDAEVTYLALWATAFDDAVEAAYLAAELLESANVERRFVAVHLLEQLNLPLARSFLAEAVDDEDPRVALYALEGCQSTDGQANEELGLFERVERLLMRMPDKKQALQPIVWPWQVLIADRSDVAAELQEMLGARPVARLLPHIGWLDLAIQVRILDQLGKPRSWDAATLAAVIALVGSGAPDVRNAALNALATAKIGMIDMLALEALLRSDQEDLREGVLSLLAKQNDRAIAASITRLIGSASHRRRMAGLELLARLSSNRKIMKQCQACLRHYTESRRHRRPEEQKALERLQKPGAAKKSKSAAGR